MTKKELDRNNIISKLLNKEINGTEAASFLKLSVRHTKRLKAEVKEKGPSALIHANRGKPSNRKMPDNERQVIKVDCFVKTRNFDLIDIIAEELKLVERPYFGSENILELA